MHLNIRMFVSGFIFPLSAVIVTNVNGSQMIGRKFSTFAHGSFLITCGFQEMSAICSVVGLGLIGTLGSSALATSMLSSQLATSELEHLSCCRFMASRLKIGDLDI